MIDFFNAVSQYAFLQKALVASLLASFAFGVTGTFVVIKRISIMSGGIAHAVLGGLGIAYYLGYPPLLGAFIFAILSAVILGFVKLKAKQKEDTVISALWSIGMALGIIFIYLTPGYSVDLFSFLFGNILMITWGNIQLLLALNAFIFAVVFIYFRQFLFISFDEEYSKIRGLYQIFIYILLLCLIGISIVILIRIVGIILVIALLTLPAAISGLFTKDARKMMGLAIILGIVFQFFGIFFSYTLNLPAGATIVIFCGAGYLLSLLISKSFR